MISNDPKYQRRAPGENDKFKSQDQKKCNVIPNKKSNIVNLKEMLSCEIAESNLTGLNVILIFT